MTIGDPKLEEHVYICGMTNPILENSKFGWDYYASIAAGSVLYKRQKISLVSKSEFKDFLKQVLTGIKNGKNESWVREQFVQFNTNFLKHVPHSKKKSITQQFVHSPLYTKYLSTSPVFPSSPIDPSFTSSPLPISKLAAKKLGFDTTPDMSPSKKVKHKLIKQTSQNSDLKVGRRSPKRVSIINFYRKLNPFVSSNKNEIVFSQKDLISAVISDGELEQLWPYVMPNSESMVDWSVTGHVTMYNMSLCIKDGLNTFYSRHNGPLHHRYEKVASNIHHVLNVLLKDPDGEDLIYSREILTTLDRKTLAEREKALLDMVNKNKRDCSFVHVKIERPIEEELLVVNSEVKQTSQRSLFVHKVIRLQSDSLQYVLLDNPEYFVYVLNRLSDEETELTQVHVVRATCLSEKRDKYCYFNTAMETRKILLDILQTDQSDYSTYVDNLSDDSDSDESSDEDELSL